MKPSIPRGTRDFGPAEMQKRQYILNIIRKNFELFGFEQIETPTMENLSTLMGKYGEEGDKLIFKVLENGDYLKDKKSPITWEDIKKLKESDIDWEKYAVWDDNSILDDTKPFMGVFSWNNFAELTGNSTSNYSKTLLPELVEKGLRYDLTVPFARFVVMNQNNLTFPFRRYQIQPVWRADRPQKGRYREFYQCDADVIGSNSLINEMDLISLIDKSFHELNVSVILKINNRKILAGLAEIIGAADRMLDIAIAIDKVDKIGTTGVFKELLEKGFIHEQIDTLIDILAIEKYVPKSFEVEIDEQKYTLQNHYSRLNALKESSRYKDSTVLQKGIEELEFLLENTSSKNLRLELDFSLARGLNYYTGTIFEVKAAEGTFTSSILGGGRYDDLTGIFGLPNMSGVGISFGVDRIYDVIEELGKFPEAISKAPSCTVLFTHFDEASQNYCLQLAAELRKNEIACEVYPDITKKIGKQFDYANKKNIPFVCAIGSDEMNSKKFKLKKMFKEKKEEISDLNIEELIKEIKKGVK